MDKIQKSGLKLNKSKCAFGLNQLKYCGQIFSDKGVKADPSKIEAITNMSTLESPADLRRFLGMVQYLAKFVPNLASNSSALRQLLVKDTNWKWTEEHTKQFHDLQFLVANSLVLKYFDTNLPIKLSVDASKLGLGSVLLQLHKDDWHPVAFASRALSKTEKIEKKLWLSSMPQKSLTSLFMDVGFWSSQIISPCSLFLRVTSIKHLLEYNVCYYIYKNITSI